MRSELTRGFVGVVLCVSLLTPPNRSVAAEDRTSDPAGTESFKPQWNVGQSWIVETQSLQVQTREKPADQDPMPVVQWQFTVEEKEKLAGRNCYRVQVQCREQGRPQPQVTLWVDADSLALRQFQTQLPVPGGFRTITESYRFEGNQPAPVMTPLTALPVDLPLFLPGKTKGLHSFQYETVASPAGQKAIGEVGFAYSIQQTIDTPKPEGVKGLFHEGFVKSLPVRPVATVRLKTFDRDVRQVWQAEQPWPAYTDNGSTVARLVKVIPAQPADSENR